MTPPLRAYRVRLYRHNADPAVDEPVTSASGGADWQAASQVDGPGFNTTCSVNLAELWSQLFESGARRIDGVATGYELIFKFGKTMDWRETFRVVIEVDY